MLTFRTHNDPGFDPNCTWGTFYVDQIIASKHELEATFGPPQAGKDDRTRYVWTALFAGPGSAENVVCIYDWKRRPVPDDQPMIWHLAAHESFGMSGAPLVFVTAALSQMRNKRMERAA